MESREILSPFAAVDRIHEALRMLSACYTGHVCHCSLGNFPACWGEATWGAVDLNLDGSSKPYRNFPGRNGDLATYTGRVVPRLRDYDLT